MEYLLSALYTIVDVACLLLFLSAFAAPRFVRHKQWLLSGAYFTTIYLILCLNMTLFEYNMSLKVTLVLACGFLFGRILYTNISTPLCIFPCPSGVSVDLSLLLYWSASIRPGVRCKCISVSPWSPCRLHHFFRYLLFFASSFYSFHRKNGQQPKNPERQLKKPSDPSDPLRFISFGFFYYAAGTAACYQQARTSRWFHDRLLLDDLYRQRRHPVSIRPV